MADKKNKKSLENSDSNEILKEEMEELARIFREELGKAREEAEEDEAEEITEEDLDKKEYEVEGYAVTKGKSKEKETEIEEEVELCECCGERPRGTARDPHSPFCKECAAIMEKYPYDVKGLIMLLVSIAFVFLSLITFAEVTPVFANTYRGNMARKEHKLYSSLSYYSDAEYYIADNNMTLDFKNLRRSEIILFYQFGVDELVETNFQNNPLLCSLSLIEQNYNVEKIRDKEIRDIYNAIIRSRVSVLMLGTYTSEIESSYETKLTNLDKDFEGTLETIEKDYSEQMAMLEKLIDKKIYVTNLKNIDTNTTFDELNTTYNPTQNDKVYNYDNGWIRFYQYYIGAVEVEALNYKIDEWQSKIDATDDETKEEKEDETPVDKELLEAQIAKLKEVIESRENDMQTFLEKAGETSTDYEVYTAPYLIQRYFDMGEYDKAEPIIKRLGERNTESVLYYDLLARLYRYRDENYVNAQKVCITGLETISYAKDGPDMIAYAGSTLSMEKTLNLIKLKEYELAYDSAKECVLYQNEYYGSPTDEARDLYCILALANNDQEAFDEIANEVKTNVELYGESYDFSHYVYEYKENKITLDELVDLGIYDRRYSE